MKHVTLVLVWIHQCWCKLNGGHTFVANGDLMSTWYGWSGPGRCKICNHTARYVEWYDPGHRARKQ